MDILLNIAQFVVNDILAVPAFLIGIITAVGMAAMKRGTGQVLGAPSKRRSAFCSLAPAPDWSRLRSNRWAR